MAAAASETGFLYNRRLSADRPFGLFGRELLAMDGTRIKAANNKDRNFTRGALSKFIREADEKLADYMKRLDDGDAKEERVGENSGSGGKLTVQPDGARQ
ncbi:hypothetical protein [Brucella cytisi]|uniref:hypothetical protein n=1 Tax=Brucella cytisi TaxID=407152 RepID=UPI00313DD6D4